MTSSLPQEVREVFERFVTCEYTTTDARGQPIVWPVTPYYSQGGASIDVTTGLGYPKKAADARRHPRVSLLFSDPTGSGLEQPPMVLVQGTADVDDRDLDANRERYWRESWDKLPGARDQHPPKAVRGLLSWYYTRIYVKVRPERVFAWPRGEVSEEPQLHDAHLEEVRSGHSEEPPSPQPPALGAGPAWEPRLDELGSRHPTAVLSWPGPDGFPLAARLPVSADRASRRIRIETEPAGLPLSEGPACVVAHAHAPDFAWQENFQVRGDLVDVDDNGGWALRPAKLVGGFELPDEGFASRMRRNFSAVRRYRRTARAELKRRKAEADGRGL